MPDPQFTSFAQYINSLNTINVVNNTKSINNTFTFGTDVEFIVRDKKTNTPVSVAGLIGGSKIEPFKVPRGALQEDGVLLELNINPAKTAHEFITNLSAVMSYARNLLDSHGLYMDLTSSAAKYPLSELKTSQAWEIGCEPFFNAWTFEEISGLEHTDQIRVAGGHLHIGIKNIRNKPEDFVIDFVKKLDQCVAPSLIVCHPNPIRAKTYGRSGSFRVKDYGFEWRVPDNWWLTNTQSINFVLSTVEKVQRMVIPIESIRRIRNIIDYQQTIEAKKLFKRRLTGGQYQMFKRHKSKKIRRLV